MGRRPTKAVNNPFCQARLRAAEYNEKFFSKEYAAEQLHISAGQLQDYELGITKCIPPDSILRMADVYRAPELRNLYCREMCPLGGDMPVLELEDLDRITVRAMVSLRKVAQTKESLLDITADGIITEDEKPELRKILATLDEISAIAQSLKVWTEKNLE
ncbi:MAG: XRE family transcriptional regulator [Hungatella sp.]|nr:XRE family transcriptional regulator [Hungatella sp.]